MRPLLFPLLLCFPLFALTQVQISGSTQTEGEALPFAEVMLLDMEGDLIKGDLSDAEGQFSLTTATGDYQLKISYLGYEDHQQILLLEQSVELGPIQMMEADNRLGEVTVRAQRRLIERQPDRLVFNVENSIAAKGGDALSALELAPGIRIQQDEISLIGRGGVGVMLNNRPLNLEGEELVALLRSLSADDLQKIEVISNPPAEYEAAGNAGLINIVMKKGRNNSWKNSTVVSNNLNNYNFSSINHTFLYQRNRLSLAASGNLVVGGNQETEWLDVFFPAGEWRMRMDGRSQRDSRSGRLSVDYELSPRFSLGGQLQATAGRPDYEGVAQTEVFNANAELDSLLINDMFSDRAANSYAYNVHFTLELDTMGRSMSMDADYFDYENDLLQRSTVNTFSPDKEFIGINLANENHSLQEVDNYSLKLDFTHPLGTTNWSYGGKLSFIETANDLAVFDRASGSLTLDPLQSNVFEYRENTQALYLNMARSLNDQLDMKVGLRFESTQTEGFSPTLGSQVNRRYQQLFPTFYLSYRPSESNQYTISYGRRINRPGFRNLNPFRVYVNSNAYSEGNPFLQPSFTDNIELSHTLNGWLTSNLFFNYTSDGYGTYFSSEEGTEIQAVLRDNFYEKTGIGLGEIVSLEPLPGWSSQSELYLFYSNSNFKPGFPGLPQNGWLLYLASSNTIKVGENSRVQLNLWYNSRHRSELFEVGAMYGLNVGFNQQFFNNKLQLSVMAQDIFNTGFLNSARSVVNGIVSDYGQNYSSRHLRFSLTYSFGNDDIQVRQRNFGNEEERGRSN
ncbi:MAG: outer membrane beta-barrel family protein [Bacteroidota bacterium]